jgi:hypothetical protein
MIKKTYLYVQNRKGEGGVMETAIIAAIIASVTTLSGVLLGHWLTVSRRKERYTDFLYQEKFKVYMEFTVILFDLLKNYSDAKWDNDDIKRLTEMWRKARYFIGRNLVLIPSNVEMSIGKSMEQFDPAVVAKTENKSMGDPFLMVLLEINRDLEIEYFHKEMKNTLDMFTKKQSEDIKAVI